MAASTNKKKIVSKDDLRQLMRAKTAQAKLSSKINHPLARYNSIGQIVCTACNTVVKSEVLWTVHIQTKSHKQNLTNPSPLPPDLKRKSSTTAVDISTIKKSRVLDSTTAKPNRTSTTVPLKSCLKTSRLAEYSSSDAESGNDDDTETLPPSLPTDFFDSQTPQSDPTPPDKPTPTMSDALPEGFFDDPVMDAKVRQVEYKDKMEEEWEKFQKSMKEQQQVYETIQEDEDEQTVFNRNIDEIDEQIQNWREVDALQDKREQLVHSKVEKMNIEVKDDADNDDMDDFDELFDWRRKTAWR